MQDEETCICNFTSVQLLIVVPNCNLRTRIIFFLPAIMMETIVSMCKTINQTYLTCRENGARISTAAEMDCSSCSL